MKMDRTKCNNIISNVVCPVETEQVVNKLQRTKFSVFIDETSDICNKKWMTFFVRYIDPETLNILVKLMNIDAKDCSATKLFNAFRNDLWTLQIPFTNIIALSCDNASVMTEKHLSFQSKLKEMCKHLQTFPCPCHSAALAAHAACTKIPSYCEEFMKRISSYINKSPKRTAIFHEFSNYFVDESRKILKLADTRWLSRYTCIKRLLQLWDAIKSYLEKMVIKDKTKSGENLLFMMYDIKMKAYFLFQKYILKFFNAFNVFFQATETRIHMLHMKSANFLMQICQNFIKQEYLKDITTNINFAQKEIHKDINDIVVGEECEEYLNNVVTEVDTVTSIRQNCLQFYETAAQEIRKRLPITNIFLKRLEVFAPSTALFDNNRETSFHHIIYVAKSLGDFDEECLKKEWLTLSTDFTANEKESIKIKF
ncbi:SCAN domain-containing protein [Ooceraea biroi]|uniref:SCAN domain-containing protein n=1 Tax=Ooceraea biroi TaxID=2015173 RepID=A0A026WLF7_OOCBI|nr:SCAN domain-containing protein [Ooceraea biroi]